MTSNHDKELDEVSSDKIPKWLNGEFFKKFLNNQYNNQITNIKILSVKPGTKPGSNFSSGLFRVKIEIESNKKSEICSLIVKSSVESFDSFNELDAFGKEIKMYSELIPAFEGEFKRCGEEVQLSAKCYASFVKNPVDILVVEDLNVKNYRVHNRFEGLDMQHCKLFMTKLAKFHAASLCYHEKHGAYGNKFQTPFRPELAEPVKGFSDALYPYFLECIKNNHKLCHLADKIVS